MRLLHPIVIKCNRCNALLKISTDLECVSSEERGMGAEYAYEGGDMIIVLIVEMILMSVFMCGNILWEK